MVDARFLAMDEELLSAEELRALVSETVLAAAESYRIGASPDTEALRSELLCRLKEHIHDYTLIRVRGQLAGVYCFYRDGGSMVMHDLYIIPEFRCHGLATAAVERCISSTELPLYVHLYNADRFTASLFTRMGFRREKARSSSVCRWIYDNCEPF